MSCSESANPWGIPFQFLQDTASTFPSARSWLCLGQRGAGLRSLLWLPLLPPPSLVLLELRAGPGHPGGRQLEDSGPEAEGRLVGSSEDRGSLGPGPSLWAGHHGAFSALGSHTESHEGCPACLLAPVPWAEDPNPLVLGRNNRVVLCKPCSVLRGAASGQPGPVILTLLEGTAEVGTPRHSRPRTVTFDFNERPCS